MLSLSPVVSRGFIADRSEARICLLGRRVAWRGGRRPIGNGRPWRSLTGPAARDRSRCIEGVAEDEAEAEGEHRDVLLEVLHEAVDADVVRPLADVVATKSVVRLVEDQ